MCVCVWGGGGVWIAVYPRTVSDRVQRKFHQNNGPRKPVQSSSEVEQSSCDLFRQQSKDGGTMYKEQYLSSDIQLYKGVCVFVFVCVCVCVC